jgi:general secretion pathway protein K
LGAAHLGGQEVKLHQRGAAILMAMLTVTLVASLAAAALWQQWRSVEVEAAQRARIQSSWILVGALDWARLILREDKRSRGPDHLAEPWAVPLEEARLATFFATDSNAAEQADDVQQSFISGQITDMQSRLNVINLIADGKPSKNDVRQFAKLFDLLGLPDAELGSLVENLRFAMDTSADNRSGSQAPLVPQRVEQLVWMGLSAQSVAAITPFVAILPKRTLINLNTAPTEVIYASIDTLDLAGARQFVTARATSQLRTVGDAKKFLGSRDEEVSDDKFGVTSDFFEVRGRLRLDQTMVLERSLVQRNELDVKTLWRERFAAQVEAGKTGQNPSLQSP